MGDKRRGLAVTGLRNGSGHTPGSAPAMVRGLPRAGCSQPPNSEQVVARQFVGDAFGCSGIGGPGQGSHIRRALRVGLA